MSFELYQDLVVLIVESMTAKMSTMGRCCGEIKLFGLLSSLSLILMTVCVGLSCPEGPGLLVVVYALA